MTSPLAHQVGHQTTTKVTQLTQYESFANSLNKLTKHDKVYQLGATAGERKAPHYFWVVFQFGYEGLGLDEFLEMWREEAEVRFIRFFFVFFSSYLYIYLVFL